MASLESQNGASTHLADAASAATQNIDSPPNPQEMAADILATGGQSIDPQWNLGQEESARGETAQGAPAPSPQTGAEQALSLVAGQELVADDPRWQSFAQQVSARSPRPKQRSRQLQALLWSLPPGVDQSETPAWIAELAALMHHRKARRRLPLVLESRQERLTAQPLDDASCLEYLAWSLVLPELSEHLPPERWLQALERLVAAATGEAPDETPDLRSQLLQGELAWRLARQFPEIAECAALQPRAFATLSAGIVAGLDEQGTPGSEWMEVWRPLWACWTRVRAEADEEPAPCWSDAAEARYQRLLPHVLRTMRKDRTLPLVHGASAAWNDDLLAAAIACCADRETRRFVQRWSKGEVRRQEHAPDESPKPLAPAAFSESACLGVLRRDWSRGSEILTVAFPDRALHGELQAGRDVLFSGDWQPETLVNGERAQLEEPWEQVCWVSDADVDYLELETQLSHGVRVQRQMLLARQDRFLLVADAVLSDSVARLEHALSFPLSLGIVCQNATETTEAALQASKRRPWVLPLSLPEWRVDLRGNALEATEQSLRLRQVADGRALFAAAWFDLSPKRQRQPFTWRPLTVAHARQFVRPDQAVAYRIQSGQRQWVVYRSLDGRVNRSFLGVNLASEFLCARFSKRGNVETLLEIEG